MDNIYSPTAAPSEMQLKFSLGVHIVQGMNQQQITLHSLAGFTHYINEGLFNIHNALQSLVQPPQEKTTALPTVSDVLALLSKSPCTLKLKLTKNIPLCIQKGKLFDLHVGVKGKLGVEECFRVEVKVYSSESSPNPPHE